PAATYVIIEVIDTGTGMDEETRKHCLEPFFSTKGEQGTGLGLAMVYGVIERHAGYVEIESELGSGTTFRIIIPTRDSLASGQKQSKNREKLPPARILFIDDEPLLREVVKELLSKDGHSVDVADGGPCGIDLFVAARKQSKPYDVVITDLGMPHINGHVISQLLKRESPQTPIILLTGWGGLSKAEGDAPPPVDLVLNKPPRLMELRNALRTVLAPSAAKR